MRKSWFIIQGTDDIGCYECSHSWEVSDVAGMLSRAIDKENYNLCSLEQELGRGWEKIPKKEYDQVRDWFYRSGGSGMLAQLDFPNDRCVISTHRPGKNEIAVTSGMISRLAGIYDQAWDQSGLLDQNAFLEGIARHYSVRTIQAEPRECISGMGMTMK